MKDRSTDGPAAEEHPPGDPTPAGRETAVPECVGEEDALDGTTCSSFRERVRKLARSLPPERVPTIFASFVDDVRLKIQQLRDAVGREDPAAVSFLAHGLRGSSALFGTDRMIELSRTLEVAAPRATPEEAEALIGQVEEEANRVSGFLSSGDFQKTILP